MTIKDKLILMVKIERDNEKHIDEWRVTYGNHSGNGDAGRGAGAGC